MKVPQDPDKLIPAMLLFGIMISIGKLLSSKQALTWRAVFGRAIEGAALATCGFGALLLPAVFPSIKEVPPLVVVAAGGLLASLGISGLLAVVRAVRGSK